MQDEGIGIRLARELSNRTLPPGVEVLELGTGGFAVVHVLATLREAVFVDCARMKDRPAGHIERFDPDSVRSRKPALRMSLHEGDLLHWIDLSRRLGECPARIAVFGIVPGRIEPGRELSPELEKRIPEYVETIIGEIREGSARE
jgi:hydrogenase maturation protease